MKFQVGDFVEVNSKEDGFLGSYFLARVVVANPAKTKLTVEYDSLVSDEDRRKKLREVVPAADVRPRPPLIGVSGFDVLDVVDAFDGDGWWVGRITEQVGSDRYCVYFDSTGDELEYFRCHLRVHQEWENGIWVLPQSKDHCLLD